MLQNFAWSPAASSAMRGRFTVTTPRFIRPSETSLPSASVQPCRKERQPIGTLKLPVISTSLS